MFSYLLSLTHLNEYEDLFVDVCERPDGSTGVSTSIYVLLDVHCSFLDFFPLCKSNKPVLNLYIGLFICCLSPPVSASLQSSYYDFGYSSYDLNESTSVS